MDLIQVLDTNILVKINSWNHPLLDQFMILMSGQLVWLPFISFFIFKAFQIFPRKHFYLFSLFLILAVISSDVTSSYILKNIFDRLRPCRLSEVKEVLYYFGQRCGGKYGFVSSHAANSICLVLFSFLTIPKLPKIFRWIWVLPFFVSYSRIYLGAHYPGDIMGGAIVGLFWGYLLARFFNLSALRSKP
jgi:undecaprenyl-diphosphatase